MSDLDDPSRSIARSSSRIVFPYWIIAIGTAILAIAAIISLITKTSEQESPSITDRVLNELEPNASKIQSVQENDRTNDDSDTQVTLKKAEATILEFDNISITLNATKQLCERDLLLMGTFAGYEFTESPYCPTNSVPNDELVLAELPHPE